MKLFNYFTKSILTFFIVIELIACTSEKEKTKTNPIIQVSETKPIPEINEKKSIVATLPISETKTNNPNEGTESLDIVPEKAVATPKSTETIKSESEIIETKEILGAESGLMGNIGGGGGGGGNFGARSYGGKRYALMKGGGSSKFENNQVEFVSKEEYDAQSKYKKEKENSFLNSTENPLSTFSIDVDTASYTNSRRWLNNGNMPKKGVVRTEEFINYFTYDYKAPSTDSEQPFSVYTEAAICPWNDKHQIIQIGLKGKEVKSENRVPSNIVFLIDVSGSMNSPDKLPLLKSGLKMLVNHLGEKDQISIVVYAGASGVALKPTSIKNKLEILNALDGQKSGGSTNGSAGIYLAYELAEANFIKDGNNRIILATDGDFNVGTTSTDELQTLIEEKRKTGVFLSVLGFGQGNLNDHLMETLANKGNGNYNYIDRLSEAQKVLVHQLNATLYTIAKDVKIQIEFNPAYIAHYRLIGYENRILAAKDFNDDKKDAGEIGAGHTITALFEIVPVGVETNVVSNVDDLKYQSNEKKKDLLQINSNDILTLKIRYKKPNEEESIKQTYVMLKNELGKSFENAKNNLVWATATAAFAQKLNKSEFLNNMSWDEIEKMAIKAKGEDTEGYRGEMIQLIKLAAAVEK